MKALVTGAGGFVGRALSEALLARGDEVRGFGRGHYPELEEMGVEMIRGDIANAGEVDDAVEGVDIVFHAAAHVGFWGDYDDFYRTNVTGTENVISACRTNRVKKLVFTRKATNCKNHGASAQKGIEGPPSLTRFSVADSSLTGAGSRRWDRSADMRGKDHAMPTAPSPRK